MPAWLVQLLIVLVVIVGVIICLNILADAGAFS